MDRFEQKLSRVFKEAFKGAELQIEPLPESDRYTGFVIWAGFKGKDLMARQQRMWKVVDTKLTKAERHRIATLLTATPEEMAESYD